VRVLVTGAGGYLGRVLVPRLRAEGHDVVELRRSGAGGAGIRIADLRDAAAVREALGDGPFDGVCHLAAATRARASYDDPLGFYATNVAGTIALLQAVTAAGARPRVVLASTGAVYAARPEPLDEAAPIAPATPYARTKRAAEDCVADAVAAGAIGAVTLRTFNVAGGADGVGDGDTTRLIPARWPSPVASRRRSPSTATGRPPASSPTSWTWPTPSSWRSRRRGPGSTACTTSAAARG